MKEKPGIFLIQGVFNISGVGTVLAGKVVDGSLIPGMSSVLDGYMCIIKTIEAKHKKIEEASLGASVGIQLEDTGIPKNQIKSYIGRSIVIRQLTVTYFSGLIYATCFTFGYVNKYQM